MPVSTLRIKQIAERGKRLRPSETDKRGPGEEPGETTAREIGENAARSLKHEHAARVGGLARIHALRNRP